MSNAGQAVLSIAGAVVGFWVGGPAGAAWGFQIGGLVGQAAFPTDLGTITGPRLNDLNVQTSNVGAPIPIIYGTYAISGNVIWSSGIIETVSKKKQGGKGGPTQTVKTYSYKVNTAVGICEGEITGIRRIWADAVLIYDSRPQQPGESLTDYTNRQAANVLLLANTEFYLGSETQSEDPTIESFEGIGNVSAFRGLAYVVFSEFQLEKYGNRVPNFRFEVAGFVSCPLQPQLSTEVLYPWLSGAVDDPRNPLNDHIYAYWYQGAAVVQNLTYEQAVQEIEDTVPYQIGGGGVPREFPYWNKGGFVISSNVAPYSSIIPGDQKYLLLYHYAMPWDSVYVGPACSIPLNQPTIGLASTAGAMAGLLERRSDQNLTLTSLWPYFLATTGSLLCVGGGAVAQFEYTNGSAAAVKRVPVPPLDDEQGAWTQLSGSFKVLAQLAENNADGVGQVTQYPLNPILEVGDPQDTQVFWEAAYADAVAAGDMPGGLTYGVDYPKTQSFAYERIAHLCTAGEEPSYLGAIVYDICIRCGLSPAQVNVDDLTEQVDGYVVTRVMSGRDAISPLRSFGYFDCVESAGVLKWPTRGKALVAALTEDDLAAHAAGDARPVAIETMRMQAVELPRRLRVHYPQFSFNYEPGEQSASRLSAGTVEVRDLEVAVAMSDSKAAQIAESILYSSWVARNTYKFSLSTQWLTLEPADAISAPIDGRQERLRITSIDFAIPGIMRVEATKDDDGVYVSYAIGSPAGYPSGSGGTINLLGTADAVIMDIPLLRDADNDAGYYVAVQAAGGNAWGGAIIYRSPDGGITYSEIGVATLEATIGEVVTPLASGPTTIVDEGNILYVNLPKGELESITDAQLIAGLNAAVIGLDDRWEVIQFRDAVVDTGTTWALSGLVRGRRGTEWAVGSSLAGDRFVLLDSALVRVPLNVSGIGATYPHKAVLAGTSIESTTAVDFVPEGVALEPFSVTDVEGTWSAGDLVITWIRRGRIGTELPSGADIPLSEESESYEIDILDDALSPAVVLRTLSASSPTVTYTEAQQIADFGSPVPANVTVRIYQLSATVGRGYPTEVTL